jgi:DNA primase
MLPYESILATVINHAELLHRHSETLAAQAFPAGQLDKLKCAIIDHAARSPRLDSEELQNHLRSLGFSAALDGLLARTGSSKWTLPTAGLDQAEAGLLHVMGVLRERDEVRTGFDRDARRLQRSLRPPRGFQGCRDGAVAVEHFGVPNRPKKIGMVPSVRSVGLASA